jgi:hypothetical protein
MIEHGWPPCPVARRHGAGVLRAAARRLGACNRFERTSFKARNYGGTLMPERGDEK